MKRIRNSCSKMGHEEILPAELEKEVGLTYDPSAKKYKWLCGVVQIQKKHMIIVAAVELSFFIICFLLNIIHFSIAFAQEAGDHGSANLILALTIIELIIAFAAEAFLLVGIIKEDPRFGKYHHIFEIAAASMLITNAVFSFAAIYGGFDERSLYAQEAPPIIILLASLSVIMCVVEVFFFTSKKKYKIFSSG